jgi:phage regulator Rha-like protein
MEIMWKIIKTGTGKKNHKFGVSSLKINNTITYNHVMIANSFNKRFTSVTDSIIGSVRSGNNDHEDNTDPTKYLFNSFKHPFSNIQWCYISTGEIENIIKSLKTKNSCGYSEIPIKIFCHFPFNIFV